MSLRKSKEADDDLEQFRRMDESVGAYLDEAIRILGLDPEEQKAARPGRIDNWRVENLWPKGIRIYRFKYEDLIPGIRILYMITPKFVYLTGIHSRHNLGNYSMADDPIVRAVKYWGKRRRGTL